MKKSEALEILAYLEEAFGSRLSDGQAMIYLEWLLPKSAEAAQAAVKLLVRNLRFFPKVSELLDEIEAQEQELRRPVFGLAAGTRDEDGISFREWLEKNPEWKERLARFGKDATPDVGSRSSPRSAAPTLSPQEQEQWEKRRREVLKRFEQEYAEELAQQRAVDEEHGGETQTGGAS